MAGRMRNFQDACGFSDEEARIVNGAVSLCDSAKGQCDVRMWTGLTCYGKHSMLDSNKDNIELLRKSVSELTELVQCCTTAQSAQQIALIVRKTKSTLEFVDNFTSVREVIVKAKLCRPLSCSTCDKHRPQEAPRSVSPEDFVVIDQEKSSNSSFVIIPSNNGPQFSVSRTPTYEAHIAGQRSSNLSDAEIWYRNTVGDDFASTAAAADTFPNTSATASGPVVSQNNTSDSDGFEVISSAAESKTMSAEWVAPILGFVQGKLSLFTSGRKRSSASSNGDQQATPVPVEGQAATVEAQAATPATVEAQAAAPAMVEGQAAAVAALDAQSAALEAKVTALEDQAADGARVAPGTEASVRVQVPPHGDTNVVSQAGTAPQLMYMMYCPPVSQDPLVLYPPSLALSGSSNGTAHQCSQAVTLGTVTTAPRMPNYGSTSSTLPCMDAPHPANSVLDDRSDVLHSNSVVSDHSSAYDVLERSESPADTSPLLGRRACESGESCSVFCFMRRCCGWCLTCLPGTLLVVILLTAVLCMQVLTYFTLHQ